MNDQIFPLLLGLVLGLAATYIIIKSAGRTDEKVKLMRVHAKLLVALLKKSGASQDEIDELIDHEKIDL